MEENKYFELVKSHKFLAQKELGQNYLIDSSVCSKIVENLNLTNDDRALEIGCGLGSLTYFLNLVESEITAIDIDESSLIFIRENLKVNSNLKILNQNALKVDFSSFNKVIGNLPYYITSSIIEKVLLNSKTLEKCVFMIQKEAYQRLCAKINTEDYSPLSLLLDFVCDKKQLFVVNRHSFCPEPHVDSVVFELNFKAHEGIETQLYFTCKKLFLHRRKTIFNNLKEFLGDFELTLKILNECNILENLRPQQLSLNDYVLLTKSLIKNGLVANI